MTGEAVNRLRIRRATGEEALATRVGVDRRELTFRSRDATLSGTLLMPSSAGPHPAIVLLHGSGRQTRWSFGPYSHFFTSLGLAVFVYDKRGNGMSTGAFFPPGSIYPDAYLDDATAALRLLVNTPGIDPRRVGIWGSSEGGMLATQVAARVRETAFLINSSGFVMPLWEQVLYNVEAQLRADGLAANDVSNAVRFMRLALDVMQTGNGWSEFEAAQTEAKSSAWWRAYYGGFTGFASVDALRRQWETYRFDPTPALAQVTTPALGVFGGRDTSTPAARAAANMRGALAAAGNRDVTVRVFEEANHPLMEARTGGNTEVPTLQRMTPGLFPTLRAWLNARIRR